MTCILCNYSWHQAICWKHMFAFPNLLACFYFELILRERERKAKADLAPLWLFHALALWEQSPCSERELCPVQSGMRGPWLSQLVASSCLMAVGYWATCTVLRAKSSELYCSALLWRVETLFPHLQFSSWSINYVINKLCDHPVSTLAVERSASTSPTAVVLDFINV